MFVITATSRTPSTLIAVRVSVTAAERMGPEVTAGQKRPRYPSMMLVFAANAVMRAIYMSQPIVKPAAGPNASRV
jgi:hypothetical protein